MDDTNFSTSKHARSARSNMIISFYIRGIFFKEFGSTLNIRYSFILSGRMSLAKNQMPLILCFQRWNLSWGNADSYHRGKLTILRDPITEVKLPFMAQNAGNALLMQSLTASKNKHFLLEIRSNIFLIMPETFWWHLYSYFVIFRWFWKWWEACK